jgi:SulP family sulfate permease
MPVLSRFVPRWLESYPRADLAAGLIVAILVTPQSMAYALLGSSRVQAVGPVAVTAIMTYAVLSQTHRTAGSICGFSGSPRWSAAPLAR